MNRIKTIANNPQVLRFGLVGGINTVLDFGILFALKLAGVPVELANIASTGTAFIFSFFANKKYTFKSSGANVVREMILFVVVTLTGLWVLQTAIIAWTLAPLTSLVENTDVALLFAKILATVVTLVWNYVLYSRLVFKQH